MAKNPSKAKSTEKQQKIQHWYESWLFVVLFCVILPLTLRSFLYAPFHIPSGSMKPTLLIGDYIFVSKFSYGYSRYSLPFSPDVFKGKRVMAEGESREPKRGDVVVFRLPTDTSVDYVKRLVGMPGDRIQVKDSVLYINGKAVKREALEPFKDTDEEGNEFIIRRYRETLPEGKTYEVLDQLKSGPLDNTPEYVVPLHHYFMMGDNRDNSQDSRVLSAVGYVPEENLIGRADMIFFSLATPVLEFWRWVEGIRLGRFFRLIEVNR